MEAVQSLDRSGRVLYLGSLSKMLSPGLRVGYMAVPEHLVEAFAAAEWLTDRQSPTLQQQALADFVEVGAFERHMRRLRHLYAKRGDIFIHALEANFPDGTLRLTGSEAGVHLVVWLEGMPAHLTAALVSAGASRGPGLAPVSDYYHRPPEQAGLLMAYSLPPEDLREGVRLLAEIVREVPE